MFDILILPFKFHFRKTVDLSVLLFRLSLRSAVFFSLPGFRTVGASSQMFACIVFPIVNNYYNFALALPSFRFHGAKCPDIL
ncbi:hypothetical protein EC99P2_00050 [Enterococcus phage EC99P2]|nr:hypothetical protein EC99P2_00050 [Enterococcus phage EC99P2]